MKKLSEDKLKISVGGNNSKRYDGGVAKHDAFTCVISFFKKC